MSGVGRTITYVTQLYFSDTVHSQNWVFTGLHGYELCFLDYRKLHFSETFSETEYLVSNYAFMPRNAQVHFRLKPEDDHGKSLIYLQFLYNKKRLFYSFGQRVNKKDWNKSKQRVKSNKATTEDGIYSLNDLLDNPEEICTRSYTSELKNGIP